MLHRPAPLVSLEESVTALRAAAEPTRLRILHLLSAGELTVSELVRILGQSQPRVSRHLKVLDQAGLIQRVSEGSWVFCRLTAEGVFSEIARDLAALGSGADETLARDRDRHAEIKAERAHDAAQYFSANAADWDRVRRLHVKDADVEAAILNLLPSTGAEKVERFLDIGTGTGRILELASDRYVHGHGVDLSRDMLAIARANLENAGLAHAQVRQADLYHLPFEGGTFEAAVIHQVLHFLDDPAAAVFEAARMLRPGGRLIVVDFAPHRVEDLRTRHQHRRLGFADGEMTQWFERAGLTPAPPRRLPGTPLTVTLWAGDKRTSDERAGGALSEAEGNGAANGTPLAQLAARPRQIPPPG